MPHDSTRRPSVKNILILGGDGYLGWSLGLAFANRTDLNVILVDSLIKRTWEKEVGAKPLLSFPLPQARIAEYQRLYGKTNLSFENVDLLDQKRVAELIRKYRPFAIVNAAQQPSAPFSMMNAKNAALTFSNNIVCHLNVLWAIAENDKNIKYVKLGSVGCYSEIDTDFLPIDKVDLQFKHDGKVKTILNSWIPMQANDFYHQSKISDFLIGDIASSVWKVDSVTVQQSTIFGATIEENEDPDFHSLSTRFNYDEIFGTVINRFVCQSAINHPITVYGDGNQRTGLIGLKDSVDNILNLTIDSSTKEHRVIHNVAERLSIAEIANTLKHLDDKIQINYLTNPRYEGQGKLVREVERHASLVPPRSMMTELKTMLDFVRRYASNIEPSIIMPKIKWDCSSGQTKCAKHEKLDRSANIDLIPAKALK